VTRSFTSSDPAEVTKFCARPFSKPPVTFTTDEVAAMRASLDMAQGALDDMRNELAVARAWGERGWARVKLLESKIDVVREVIR
jgi:predicted DNA-binding transcriptional regulator YafY